MRGPLTAAPRPRMVTRMLAISRGFDGRRQLMFRDAAAELQECSLLDWPVEGRFASCVARHSAAHQGGVARRGASHAREENPTLSMLWSTPAAILAAPFASMCAPSGRVRGSAHASRVGRFPPRSTRRLAPAEAVLVRTRAAHTCTFREPWQGASCGLAEPKCTRRSFPTHSPRCDLGLGRAAPDPSVQMRCTPIRFPGHRSEFEVTTSMLYRSRVCWPVWLLLQVELRARLHTDDKSS